MPVYQFEIHQKIYIFHLLNIYPYDDNHKLFTCSHFLSVSERKSRINLFYIFNCLVFRPCTQECILDPKPYFLLTTESVDGLSRRFNAIPSRVFCWFLFSLCIKFRICSCVSPNYFPILLNLIFFSKFIYLFTIFTYISTFSWHTKLSYDSFFYSTIEVLFSIVCFTGLVQVDCHFHQIRTKKIRI